MHARKRAPRAQMPDLHSRTALRGTTLHAPHRLGAMSALASAVVLMLLAWGRGQPVVLAAGSSEGCVQRAHPTPPAHLAAVAKDGQVVLTWAAPTDGSCVDTYVIDAFDATLRASSPLQLQLPVRSSSTDGLNYTMAGLQNGRAYRFRVQSFAEGAAAQAPAAGANTAAEVVATPTDKCLQIPPGKPVGLWVTPGEGMAQLCWLGVDNDACVDEYRAGAVRADSQFRAKVGDAPISKGGCVNISRLEDGVRYTFTVLPYAAAFGEGPAARETSYVGTSEEARNGWTCVRHATCRPNTLSLCSAVGCQAMTRGLGSCKGPAMFDIDHLKRRVTQWCSDVCACDLSVATAFSPLSWGLLSGVTETASQLAGLGGGPSAPAPAPQAALPADLVPSLVQGAAGGLMQSLQKGATLGSGQLAANMLGSMMQATAESGVVGQSLGDAVGSAASTMVSSIANSVIDGMVGALTNAG